MTSVLTSNLNFFFVALQVKIKVFNIKIWTFICSVRAALNGILETLINLGFIVSFLLGKYLNFSDQPKMYLIVPTIAAIILFILPESPVFLAKNGKEQVSYNNWNQCVTTMNHSNWIENNK